MKNFLIKNLLIAFFVLSTIVALTPYASAGVWGEPIVAAMLGEKMRRIYEELMNAMIAAAKKQAIIEYNKTVTQMVAGGPLFITNWEQFLVEEPAQKTELYMNDFFTSLTKGKGSSLNYLSSGSHSFEGNYASQLVRDVQGSLLGNKNPQFNFQEYADHPSEMFSQGNLRAFTAFISYPVNNPFGLSLLAQDEMNKKMEEETREAEIKAIAYQGYIAKEKDGKVITPGSTIKDIISNAEDLPNKILANARSLPEVIATVIVKQAGKTLRQGIGDIQSKLQKEVDNVVNNYNRQMRNIDPSKRFNPAY